MNTRILGVVLAGGKSNRFGTDKAMTLLGGLPILFHVLNRAAHQVAVLVVNRNGCNSPAAGYPQLKDNFPGDGPLAGVLAGLEYAALNGFARVATFPCDSPFFPSDTVRRLSFSLAMTAADYSVARHNGRNQHAFSLWKTECLVPLRKAFAEGLRSFQGCAEILERAHADFPGSAEAPDSDPFFNINTLTDFERASAWLSQSAPRLPFGLREAHPEPVSAPA